MNNMTNNIIFIDGESTRAAVDEMAGQKEGMTKLCKEKGISSTTLNKACRNGYGTIKSIEKMIKAGIPIKLARRPVQSRLRKKHNKTRKEKPQPATWRGPAPNQTTLPTQIKIEDIQNNDIKELLISHLTALIEDLKKI